MPKYLFFLGDQVNLDGFTSYSDDVRIQEWQGSEPIAALAQVICRNPESS